MTIDVTDHDLWQAARKVCTPKQLEILQLRSQGLSLRTIGLALDLDPATVRGHLQRAERRIHHHLKEHHA